MMVLYLFSSSFFLGNPVSQNTSNFMRFPSLTETFYNKWLRSLPPFRPFVTIPMAGNHLLGHLLQYKPEKNNEKWYSYNSWQKQLTSHSIITVRKRSCGKGNVFTPVYDSIHRGGFTPPLADTQPPRADTPPRWPLQRTVRILLECILVQFSLHLVEHFVNTDKGNFIFTREIMK